MRACPACGASNAPTDDFCANCGAYLNWSSSAPSPSAAPPAGEAAPGTPPGRTPPGTGPAGTPGEAAPQGATGGATDRAGTPGDSAAEETAPPREGLPQGSTPGNAASGPATSPPATAQETATRRDTAGQGAVQGAAPARGGTSRQETAEDATPHESTPPGGAPQQGTTAEGTPRGGAPHPDVPRRSTAQDRPTPGSATPQEPTPPGGTPQQDTARTAPTRAPRGGTAGGGAAREAASDGGAPQEGTPPDGRGGAGTAQGAASRGGTPPEGGAPGRGTPPGGRGRGDTPGAESAAPESGVADRWLSWLRRRPGQVAPTQPAGAESGSVAPAGAAAPSAGPGPAPVAPARPAQPAPRPPAHPAPASPAPVLPAMPVAPRPVVRPLAVSDDVAGVPCPACGTPNPPDRRFCRRCAAPLTPSTIAAPLPWWRTVWPLRRRTRAGSGRLVRFLVVLTVVLALCAAGFLLLPAGQHLVQDTLDKLGKAKAVTPTRAQASAELPGHPVGLSTDGLSNRYWAAPGSGTSATYTFGKPFRLVAVIITNGASPAPEEYAKQGRALRIDMEVTDRDGATVHKQLVLSDKPGPQTFPTGISDVATVRLTLQEPAGSAPERPLALAEVEFFQRG